MVSGLAKAALGSAGLWTPATAAERATRQGEELEVDGDRPPQRRLRYSTPRPAVEIAADIVYTPSGQAIEQGRIRERHSIGSPSVREILAARFVRHTTSLEEAYILESETLATYGDWVGDGVCALMKTADRSRPVLLPAALGAKSYVRRDIAALGFAALTAETPVLVRRAHVLRKLLPSYYWGPDEAQAYRRAFSVQIAPPTPGSLLYLARYDTISESKQRSYPSEQVAAIVHRLGGVVFDTRQASPSRLERLGAQADIVIADQGSALFGVLHWNTRSVIELYTADWWHNANLFFARAAGVENYAVVNIAGMDIATIEARILGYLESFGRRRPDAALSTP